MAEQTIKNAPQVRFKGFSEEWEDMTLGELLSITSAARVHKNEWTESGVPFFRSSDVVSNYKGNENKKAYISQELYKELTGKIGRVKKGDILVTGGGSIGIPYLIDSDDPLYFKDADLLWLKTGKEINSYFLYTFFSAQPFRQYLRSISHIGTIAHYTVEQVKSTPIRFPKKNKEQLQVGTYFHELDQMIGLHQRKHEKLVTLKMAMLKKMFPQNGTTSPEIRFKGFSKPWVEKKLGEYAKFSKGQGYSKGDLVISGAPIVLYGRLYTNYQTVISEVDTFVLEKTGSVKSTGREVIVPSSGETAEDIARASAIVKAGLLLGGDLNIILPASNIDSCFLALTISNGTPQKDLERRAQGKTVVHIRNSDLEEVEVQYPSMGEQQKISTYFRQLDELIAQHGTQVTKLKQLKTACLEKMFV